MSKNKSSKSETLGSRLRQLRRLCSLSRPIFCQQHSLSFSTYRSWENNTGTISTKSLQRLLSAFSREGILVSNEWILTGRGLPPTLAKADLININLVDQKIDKQYESPIQLEVDAFIKNNSNSIVTMASQDYPNLKIKRGDLIGGIKIDFQDLEINKPILTLISLSDEVDPNKLQLYQLQKYDDKHVTLEFFDNNDNPTELARDDLDLAQLNIENINKLYQILWLRYLA